MRIAWLVGTVGTALFAVTWLGCNSLLGLADPQEVPFPPEGGASEGGASGDGGASGPMSDDPNNCGSVGHVCNAGTMPACQGGLCNYTFAVSQRPVYDMLISQGTLYWAISNQPPAGLVVSCPTVGCSLPTTVVPSLQSPFGLALDSTNAYWTTLAAIDGVVQTCPLTGCSSPTNIGTEATGAPTSGIVVVGGNVYYIAGYGIQSCATDGGGCQQVYGAGNPYPFWIATDGTDLFWTDNILNLVLSCPAAPAACTNPKTVATGQAGAAVIVADANNVYWMDAVADPKNTGATINAVYSCAKTGCGGSPTVLAQDLPGLGGNSPGSSMVIDGSNLYWTNTTMTGTVMKCAVTGCGGTPTVLAAEQSMPFAVVVDDTNVYWSNLMDGTIRYTSK